MKNNHGFIIVKCSYVIGIDHNLFNHCFNTNTSLKIIENHGLSVIFLFIWFHLW